MMRLIFVTAAVLLSAFAAQVSDASSPASDDVIAGLRKAFVETSIVDYSPSWEITDRFLTYSDWGRANDVLLLQLYMSVHLPDGEAERLLGLIDGKGAFTDIDYTDRTRGRWQPTLHLTRLYSLMKLYRDPSSGWYGNGEMRRKFHRMLDYWFSLMPESDNWWHNEIGVPRKMTAILLMFGDEVTERELRGGLAVLEKSQFGMTGQNRVWLAINNLMKGLLIGDETLVRTARDVVAEEISLTEGEEGIQKDWAFHQHGPQIQFGNYGLTYAESVSSLFRVLDGSPYEFSDSQYGVVDSLLMEGIAWSVWKGMLDPSFCGRQVFIDAGRGKAYSTAVSALNLAALGKDDSDRLRRTADRIFYPEKYPETITGARYYGSSDCGIYRTEDWYSSVRMHSDRTVGFEFTNDENMNAWFSADGALLFMQNGNEYENIFARWDWRKVPGVTAYDNGKPLKTDDDPLAKRNRTGHVGGAVAGDVMCTTMEINRDSLHALKTVCFFDDVVVALGAAIGTDDPTVFSLTTAIDQTNLAGNVVRGSNWVHHNGRGYVLLPQPGDAASAGESGVVAAGQSGDAVEDVVSAGQSGAAVSLGQTGDAASAGEVGAVVSAEQSGVVVSLGLTGDAVYGSPNGEAASTGQAGAVSLEQSGDSVKPAARPGRLVVTAVEQSGKWDLIDPFYKDRWDAGKVFKCYVEHDPYASDNTYAYAVLPCRSSSETELFAEAPPIRILCNTALCQAVEYGDVICAVFHAAGSFTAPDGISVEADGPAVMILREGESVAETDLEPLAAIDINSLNLQDMKTRSKTFQIEDEMVWQEAGQGVRRQIMGDDGQLMMVKVQFEKGAVGTAHSHYHSQSTYVASGKFEVTIGDEKAVLSAGEGYYVEPDVLHGCVCLEAGTLIDTFSPVREDFLKAAGLQ